MSSFFDGYFPSQLDDRNLPTPQRYDSIWFGSHLIAKSWNSQLGDSSPWEGGVGN